MTGPEHYRKAEHLLKTATAADVPADDPGVAAYVAEAQVHATLALAAATAAASMGIPADGVVARAGRQAVVAS